MTHLEKIIGGKIENVKTKISPTGKDIIIVKLKSGKILELLVINEITEKYEKE